MRRSGLVALLAASVLASAGPAWAAPFRVLVTNDDGVGSAGLSALVARLGQNPKLAVTVIAPATNQSGVGDSVTTGPFGVTAAATAGGFPATAVAGFPADTILFAVRTELPARPDLVVSGINAGQNVSREIVDISGTVGAAITAARLGVPAIAVSQGIVATDFTAAAAWVGNVVEDTRRKGRLLRKLASKNGVGRSLLLNVNFPTCSAGSVRGVRVVPLDQFVTVTGYTLLADDGTTRTYQATTAATNLFATNCTSTLKDPATDAQALTNGFASVTPLNPDLTVDASRLRRFRFLERIPF